jgi:predicted nucleic acid-binding protein
LKIYFDACTLCRLTDELDQPRLQAEADAVEAAVQKVIRGEAIWIASSVLSEELARNTDLDKRDFLLNLLRYATERVMPTSEAIERAADLKILGYGVTDALHIAVAEQELVNVLLTTDDRLLRRAERGIGQPRVEVLNPIIWMQRGA